MPDIRNSSGKTIGAAISDEYSVGPIYAQINEPFSQSESYTYAGRAIEIDAVKPSGSGKYYVFAHYTDDVKIWNDVTLPYDNSFTYWTYPRPSSVSDTAKPGLNSVVFKIGSVNVTYLMLLAAIAAGLIALEFSGALN